MPFAGMLTADAGTVYGRRVRLGGEWFDAITEETVADRVVANLEAGRGGRIVTPNVDILRLANGHGRRAAEVRGFLADATLIVADGMPLVWASRLAGTPLPERVTGSGLIWTLSAALGRANRSVFVLGGRPAPNADRARRAAASRSVSVQGGRPAPDADGAQRAAATLAASCPGLRIAGHHAPPFEFEREPGVVERMLAEVEAANPDFVFVGLGFLKQERIIGELRQRLPYTWFLGCGAAIGFVAGDCKRAPFWMQRLGLEWAHRLAKEPGRLAGRYLAHDAPYAMKLLARAAISRCR